MTKKTAALDTFDFDLAYVTGHFDPAVHPDFTPIDTAHADRPGLYLRKDTYSAFKMMFEAALRDSIKLVIRSATPQF